MLINGQEFTFCDLKLSMLGNKNVAGVTSITYEVAQKNSNEYGSGKKPIAYVIGREVYQGEMKFTMKELMNIRAANGGRPLTSVRPFIAVLTYSNGTDKDKTTTLFSVRFTKDAGGGSGEEMLEVTVPISIGDISFAS